MIILKEKPHSFSPRLKSSTPTRDTNPWQSWSQLMSKVQDGDAAAYRQLLDEIGPLLYNFVRKRVYNREMVEDVYQEVMMTFHKARHTYDTDRPLGPWLFAVARHTLLTTLGKNRKFAEKELPMEFLPDVAPEADDPGLSDDLYKALKSIPELNRRAVELLKIRGLSLEDAARELCVSVAALKVRAHRGYVFLRKALNRSVTQEGRNLRLMISKKRNPSRETVFSN